MLTFILSLIALLLGFVFYSRVAERVFGPDDRDTPAIRKADGVDYIVLPTWRIFMIQFLNIAGTGPILTGDTCFRSARLIVAETLHYGQRSVLRRLSVSFPLFAVALAMLVWQIKSPDGFRTIWQYMGWGTQFLAAVSLWVSTVYLATQRKCYWITFLPAVFMTLVSMSFLMVSKTAFGLSEPIGFTLAALIVVACVTRFFFWRKGIKFDTK